MSLTDTFDNPQSRVEAILQNAMGAENEVVPQSRVEELLERLDDYLENIEGKITEQDEEIIAAVNAWLGDHPEATTTVLDGSLTESKFSTALKDKLFYKTYYMSDYEKVEGVTITDFVDEKIQEGYRRFVFPKNFVLNETLRLHNIRSDADAKGVIIEGETANDVDSLEPDIILNTGGIGIELIETHSCVVKNLTISSRNANNPSTVGILLGRDSTIGVGSSNTNQLSNVSVYMKTLGDSINDGYGSIGIYSNTSEVMCIHNVLVRADTPCILTQFDICDLNPENTYTGSNKDYYFIGSNSFSAFGNLTSNRAMVFDGVGGINGNVYIHIGGNAEDRVGLEVKSAFSVNLVIDCEGAKYGLLVNGNLTTSNINGVFAVEDTFIQADTGTFTSNNICVYASYTGANKNYININGAYVSNCLFVLSADQNADQLNISSGVFAGNIIRSVGRKSINETGGSSLNNMFENTAGIFHTNRRITYNWGNPQNNANLAPFTAGEFFFDSQYSTGGQLGWIYDGANFVSVGQTGMRALPDPTTATPKHIMEVIKDASNNLWMAYGTGVGEFKQISN